MTRAYAWEDLSGVPLGTYVELRGGLRAQRPARSPTDGLEVLGFHVLCSLFTKSASLGVPEFARREDRVVWSDAVLTDPSGEQSMSVALDEGPVKVPARHESTLSDEAMIALLDRLDLPSEGVVQVQVLERSVPDGASVRIRGVLADVAPAGPAFRSSARARRGLVGERRRPLVVL
ncbi:MAG: hypothetical protein AB8I08_08955 [Sandaracinaceae bacterium]